MLRDDFDATVSAEIAGKVARPGALSRRCARTAENRAGRDAGIIDRLDVLLDELLICWIFFGINIGLVADRDAANV